MQREVLSALEIVHIHVFDAVIKFPCYLIRDQFLEEDMSGYCVESLFEVNKAGVNVFTILETISIEKVEENNKGV